MFVIIFLLIVLCNTSYVVLLKANRRVAMFNEYHRRIQTNVIRPLEWIFQNHVKIVQNVFGRLYFYEFVGLPSSLDHVLLDELPSLNNLEKYIVRRFFLKPDHFGFEEMKTISVLRDHQGFIIEYTRQRLWRLIKGELTAECAKLVVFKKNMDREALRIWKKVLLNLTTKWKIDKTHKEHVNKYGIWEINQPSRDLKSADAGIPMENFRKYLEEKYGSDNLSVRKGREIIFMVDELLATHSTCEPSSSPKYSTLFFKSLFYYPKKNSLLICRNSLLYSIDISRDCFDRVFVFFWECSREFSSSLFPFFWSSEQVTWVI